VATVIGALLSILPFNLNVKAGEVRGIKTKYLEECVLLLAVRNLVKRNQT
jgi:hypothetical protein